MAKTDIRFGVVVRWFACSHWKANLSLMGLHPNIWLGAETQAAPETRA
jgi:hypothetical protein